MNDQPHHPRSSARHDRSSRALVRPHYVELPPLSPPAEFGPHDLMHYWHGFLQRKWLVLLLSLAGACIGLATVIPKSFTYHATTTVEIQGFNENFMNMSQVDPQASAGMYSPSAFNILTQVKILNSDSLKRRVLEKLERETIPSLPPEPDRFVLAMNTLRRSLGVIPAEPAAALRQALQEAVGAMNARAVEGTRVIEIRCTSTHPDVAAEFCNSLVNEYVDDSLESRSRGVQRTNRWMLSQLDEMKTKVEQAETKLKDFVATAGVMGLSQEQKNTLAAAKLQQLQQELSAIQADRIAKQTRYEMVASTPLESLPDVVDDGSLRDHRTRLADLRRDLAQLNLTLTPEHYRVKRLEAQIAEVETALRKESANALARIKNEYQAALRREKLLGAAYGAQSGTVLSQADKELQYNLLRREVDSTRQIYNVMLQQVNQAGVTAAMPTTNLRTIDPAVPSRSPTYRDVFIHTGLGWVTGLLFGCVMAVILYQHDPRVRQPGHASYLLDVPELGVIPSDLELARKRLPGSRAEARRREENGEGSVELVTLERKPSPVAESFRAVLASLLLPHSDGAKPRTIVVTSPEPRDGKSTMASNLGIALAEVQHRVAIIDADMRHPRLHEIFRVPNTWGLTNLIQERGSISHSPLEALVRPTGVPGLFLLPSGPSTLVASAMLYSERIQELLNRLRQEFDYVLIDTPPVLAAPDARVLGRLTDGVILVFRSGKTTRDAALAVGKRFAADGTPILGSVLNDWDPKSRRHGYGYYAYHHYYPGGRRG